MRSLCDHNSNRLGVELALIDPVFLPVIRGVGGGGGGMPMENESYWF